MNDDDLYGPKLSAPPTTSPLVRGAVVVAVVSATMVGCSTAPPGNDAGSPGLVFDGGISAVDMGNPGLVFDAGVSPPDAAPGVDAGADAGNPGEMP